MKPEYRTTSSEPYIICSEQESELITHSYNVLGYRIPGAPEFMEANQSDEALIIGLGQVAVVTDLVEARNELDLKQIESFKLYTHKIQSEFAAYDGIERLMAARRTYEQRYYRSVEFVQCLELTADFIELDDALCGADLQNVLSLSNFRNKKHRTINAL